VVQGSREREIFAGGNPEVAQFAAHLAGHHRKPLLEAATVLLDADVLRLSLALTAATHSSINCRIWASVLPLVATAAIVCLL